MGDRRRLASLVALAAALGLGACGGGEAEDGASTTAPGALPLATTSSAPTSSTAVTTTAATPTTAAPPTTAATAPRARVIAVTVRGGSVEGGARREPVELGEQVRLQVTSDVADEVHVHGYDRRADVTAGGSVDLEFAADLPGVWEVELEGRGVTLLELAVTP